MNRTAAAAVVRILPAVVVAAGCLPGCSGDGRGLVPVQGQLTSQGEPLGDAWVSFIPNDGTVGLGAGGQADAEGRFSLIGSRRGARGCPPGEYRVRISRQCGPDGSPVPPDAAEPPSGLWESIPVPYSVHDDTPLTVTVPRRGGKVIVDLPVPPLAKRP
jgi:hypothetical protein